LTREKIPGLNGTPVALLGTSEKGYLSLTLKAEKAGGHSSMPEKETAIDILSAALVKLRDNPFDPEFSESTQGLLEHIGPEFPFAFKMAFANQWLFKSVIVANFSASGPGNAMVRTTAVPTILSAGIKDNVVPAQATATVNFRLLPGDKSEEVIRRVREILNDDRITIDALPTLAEASPVTSAKSFGYKKIEQITKKSLAGTITSPFLVIGATDSRHFIQVSQNIIKFSPMIDPIGFHGIDERVSLESYRTGLWFYEQLMRSEDN
jgi:carboxypeptidase PM20D1